MVCINSLMIRNLLFLSLLLISVCLINVGASSPTYLYHVCRNTTINNSSTNSLYLSNLNSLNSSLFSNVTDESRDASVGGVYGLFFCRGDVDATACGDCVAFAARDVIKRCPTEGFAIIWYDECQLRYSSRSFSGTVATRPGVYLLNTANVTDKERFKELLNVTMKEAATQAARGEPGKTKFGTRDADFNGFQRLYNLAQCTPDLSSRDCDGCLTEAIANLPNCCDGKLGGRVLFPSCNIRYEFYPFYSLSTSSPPSMAFSPVLPPRSDSSTQKEVVVTALLVVMGCFFLRRRARKTYKAPITQETAANDITGMESLQFEFTIIETATDKFADYNMLGKGGFGEVYKGTLPNGQNIAVKRLSTTSGQGALEFKNEVVLVAKLQHRNLIRLLGFCSDGDERILVYEYVSNKSLDHFIFDPKKQGQLNWSIRCKIIEGIARGVLYLHEDSRLKIIHRDLKASNILLDKEMNPKVSDFGMAKMFGVDQTQGNTKRIVGTYGYMAPEYAMRGFYSIKLDVFSFGVLLLEILSGRRNTSFHITDCALSLVAYAWQLWNEGKALDLVDSCLKDSCQDPNKFLRYIQIGLLCVQEDEILRPTMSSVVLMLKSEALSLSQPERPAFIANRHTSHQEIIALNNSSVNGMTVSDFLPR